MLARAAKARLAWRKEIGPVATLGVLACLGACAIPWAGKDFPRPEYQSFSSQTLSENEVLAKYGPPFSRGKFTKHGRIIHTLHYFYETSQPTNQGVQLLRKKLCWFYFAGDEYLGYAFSTAIEKGQTDFDDRKVARILKGTTRKGEVVAAFGVPSGALRYPATPEDTTQDGDSILDYEYHSVSQTGKAFHHKSLRVIFGPDDIVKDVDFDSNDRDEGPPSGERELYR